MNQTGLRTSIRRLLLYLILLTLGIYPIGVLVFWTLGLSHPSFFDSSAYYQSSYKFLNNYPIYASPSEFPIPPSLPEHLHSGPYGRNVYPPLVTLFFAPLSILGFWVSGWLWVSVSLLLLLSTAAYFYSQLNINIGNWEFIIAIWCISGFYVVKQSIYMGQITLILTSVLIISASFLYKNNPEGYLASLMSAIPVFVKPYYATTLAHLLNDWKKVAVSAGTFLTLTATSMLVFGPDTYLIYLEVVTSGIARDGYHSVSEWSGGVYKPLFVFHQYTIVIQAISVLSVAGFSYYVSREDNILVQRYLFVLGISTLVIFTPGVKKYTLVTTIPAILVLLTEEYVRDNGIVIIPLLSILMIHSHAYFVKYSLIWLREFGQSSLTVIIPYVQPALWGSLLLFVLSIYRSYTEYVKVR